MDHKAELCVCGCERDRESVHVSHTNKYQREMRSRETEFCVCERERYFTTRVIARETYEGTQDISRERESVCERHTREQWRNMRPRETQFVFVCEKEIFKRKSRRFS